MTSSPHTLRESFAFAHSQAVNPTQDWTGYCQMFVRSCWGIPALFGSAWAQWLGADDEDKHIGGDIHDAPVGSALCFKGSSPFGHIDHAAPEFKNGNCGAWSNDLVTYGHIDKVLREAPTTEWGQKYLGYLTAVNDYDLQLKKAAPPKPKQDKRYKSIEKAINRLEDHALKQARQDKDFSDVKQIQREIKDLKALYAKIRHA